MKIDMYEPVRVFTEYDYREKDDNGEDGKAYTIVMMGDVEVYRSPQQMYSGYGMDKDFYRNQEYDRAVGEFAKRLLKVLPE